MAHPIHTIGHSDHTIDALIGLLRNYDIDTVVDVRSKPYSRRVPWFSRDALRDAVKAAGLHYAWMGDSLGGIPDDESFYLPDGRVDYQRLAATERFREGLRLLRGAAEKYRVALLCAEGDPSGCHRHLLVALGLVNDEVPADDVRHILRDGTSITESAMIRQPSLFGGGQWKSSPLGSRGPRRSTSSGGFELPG